MQPMSRSLLMQVRNHAYRCHVLFNPSFRCVTVSRCHLHFNPPPSAFSRLRQAGIRLFQPCLRQHVLGFLLAHATLHGAQFVCLLVGCLTSQQHASVSQGRICADNFTCCHTEIEAADQTFHLTQSQYTDTGPTSPSADPIMPGAWQGSHWSANV